MRTLTLISILLIAFLGPMRTVAEPRSPGSYQGTVVFDRWDGCYLYSGVYLHYVAEKVKGPLRPHSGKLVQLDVTDIRQPINPGDGRITSYSLSGAGRPRTPGLELQVSRDGRISPMHADQKPPVQI